MPLASVENPKKARSPFESVEMPRLERDIIPGAHGEPVQERSRASEHFLVRGTRKQPLRSTSNVFESLLTDVDRRKQILETDLVPWRKICALEIINQNGLLYIGTGWFAAPKTIITAGHCVFDPVELGGWARSITVMPGRNGDSMPYSKATSVNFSTTDSWLNSQSPDYDYAAIHLDDDIGTRTGTFGLGVLTDDDLKDRMLNVSGYPVSPGNGQLQYFHANRVKALTDRRIFYDIDTMGGQSGSPVWAYLDGSDDAVVVGIHAYGVGGTPAGLHVVANSGPRILPEVKDVIRGWIARGTPA